MRLFGYLVLLLWGTLDATMGSSVKSIQSMSMEDAVMHLNERISLLEKRDTSDLAQKIKGEILVEVQNVEKRFLEEKNELAKKISELETAIDSKHRDLSSKLGELEERTWKQKDEISDVSERLQDEKVRHLLVDNQISMEVHQLQRRALETFEKMDSMKTEIRNVSETGRIKTDMLQVEINETRNVVQSCVASQRATEEALQRNMSSVDKLRTQVNENLTSRLKSVQSNLATNMGEVQRLHLTTLNTVDKIKDVKKEIKNVLETGYIITDMLQVEINETRKLVQSSVASQRATEEALRKNMSSVEKLRTQVNESLTSRLESVQTSLRTNMGKLENSLLIIGESCVNVSYASSLEENLRNLSRTTESELQSIRNELHPRITLLEEGRSDSTNDVVHIKKVLTNHTSEISSLNTRLMRVEPVCDPPCQNGGTCWRNNTCSCTPTLFSGDRCQNDHSKCGLDLRDVGIDGSGIVGGSGNNAPAWPWMAALYMNRSNSLSLVGGGSVIHRHFILTSARNVHTTRGRRASSELKVRLGLTNLNDLTRLQEHNVRTIYFHPQFRNPDYDIALLELEKPIDYNLFVRPVCLPPTEIPEDDIFYKPQSSAQAIGFGYNHVVPKFVRPQNMSVTPVLKNIDLVIQPPDICRKSLEDDNRADLFTDRMFCAAEGKPSFACYGDEGGPAMQSHLNREGTARIWTQVGIVSWGPGCGLKDEYKFFTHLQNLMPWVDATIEAATKR